MSSYKIHRLWRRKSLAWWCFSKDIKLYCKRGNSHEQFIILDAEFVPKNKKNCLLNWGVWWARVWALNALELEYISSIILLCIQISFHTVLIVALFSTKLMSRSLCHYSDTCTEYAFSLGSRISLLIHERKEFTQQHGFKIRLWLRLLMLLRVLPF